MNCFVLFFIDFFKAAVDVSVSAAIFSRLRANISWAGDMGQESRWSLKSWKDSMPWTYGIG